MGKEKREWKYYVKKRGRREEREGSREGSGCKNREEREERGRRGREERGERRKKEAGKREVARTEKKEKKEKREEERREGGKMEGRNSAATPLYILRLANSVF